MGYEKRTKPVEVVFPDFGVYALESHHGEAFRMDVLRHDFSKLVFVIDGKGTLEADGRNFALKPGAPVYIPFGTAHRVIDQAESPLSLYAVCMELASMPAVLSEAMRLLDITWVRTRFNVLHWHEKFRQLLYEQTMGRADRSIAILEIVLWMIRQVSRCGASDVGEERSADRVRSYTVEMEQAFYQEQTLADAAQQVGLGERRFSQLFRELNGTSWLSHLRTLRIEHACLLLKDTDHSPTAISYECGFSDLSNFYRAFKKRTGMAPLDFRAVSGRE